VVAFGAGGYVRLDHDGWILVAPPRAPLGPLSLSVAGLGTRPARPTWEARKEPDALVLGPWRIDVANLKACIPPAPQRPGPGIGGAMAAALAACPSPPADLLPGLAALGEEDAELAIDLLAGRGEGLTPLGDDVLAGWAAWRHWAAAPVTVSARAAGRSSPLGLAYLRCAERGELAQPAAALLVALMAGDASLAARRARVLRCWGASSGVALLWGMAAATGG
jgi:hypothetical protein